MLLNNFLKIESNMGMLHSHGNISENIFYNLETNTPLVLELSRPWNFHAPLQFCTLDMLINDVATSLWIHVILNEYF